MGGGGEGGVEGRGEGRSGRERGGGRREWKGELGEGERGEGEGGGRGEGRGREKHLITRVLWLLRYIKTKCFAGTIYVHQQLST